MKKIILLLLFLCFVLTNIKINATEQTEYVSYLDLINKLNQTNEIKHIKLDMTYRNYDQQITILTYDKYDISDLTTNYHGPIVIHKDKNNNFIFCIEPLVNSFSSAQSITYSNSKFSKLSTEKQNQINNYSSTAENLYKSTNDIDYIHANQLLIWDTISPEIWDLDKAPLLKAKIDEIKSTTSKLNAIKSSQITLKYNEKNNTFEYLLKNGAILLDKRFVQYNEDSNIKLTKVNNDLLISTQNYNTSIKNYIFKIKKYNDYKYFDAGQDLVGYKLEPKDITFKISTEEIKGGFSLTKNGEQRNGNYESLENVEFTVVNNNTDFKKVFTTDENGEINVERLLEFGSYTITETKSLPGYEANYSEQFNITSDNQIVDLNNNSPILNDYVNFKIMFLKKGESPVMLNENLLLLNNVKFELYEDINNNEKLDSSDILVSTQISKDGLVEFNDIGPFVYLLKESSTLNNYVLDDEVRLLDFRSKTDDIEINLTDDVNYINEYKKGELNVHKIGIQSGEKIPLENVEFEVYQDLNNNKLIDNDDVFIDIYKTDKNGDLVIDNLKYANYILKESKTNEEFILNDELISVKIDDEFVQLDDIINVAKYNKLTINKIDNDTNEYVDGAKFEVYELDNKSSDEIKIDNNTYKVNKLFENKDLVTNDGKIKLDNLAPNTYIIKEVEPPVGYELNTNPYQLIEIPTDNELIFKNIKISSNVTINKIDEQTNEKLSGTSFVLKDKQGNEIKDFIVNKDGFNIKLDYGDYYLCETKAPIGYEKSDKCLEINISDNSDKVVNFTNKKTDVKISTTGYELRFVKYLIVSLSIVLISILYYKHKKIQ